MILWYSDVVNSLSTFLSQCFENASSLASQTLDAFQLSLSSVLFIAIILLLCESEMSTKVVCEKSGSGVSQRGLGHLSLSTVILGLMIFFSSFLCSSGYYQHPEVVEFTAVPGDAVVCGGCRLEMSCSILRQETAASLPQPELEWMFNGSRLTELEVFPGTQVQTLLTTTHVSLTLTIENATAAEHSGTYQCRVTDGNSPDHCGAAGDSSILACVPTTTISKPARIQIVDDAVSTEPVSVGSSCSSGVALLPCGGRLMQQGTALRETLNLNLTWRRNGEELTLSPETEVVLSNGDLVLDTVANSSGDGDLYECVASFEQQNVTLARYRLVNPHGHSGSGSSMRTEDVTAESTPTDYLKLTSSRAVVVEGESVELVCEASVSWVEGEEVEGEREEGSGGHGQCEPYNVTWSSSGSDGALLRLTVDSTDTSSPSSITQLLNNHILRVGGVSSGSTQYCCEVHTAATGQRIGQECTTIHVVPQRGLQAVHSKTIFLKTESESNVMNINCSAPSAGSHGNVTWYHNGDVIEGFYDSSLTLSEGGSVSMAMAGPGMYGVYQCFSDNGLSVEESSLVRVLPYGLTNPPSQPIIREVPYPGPGSAGSYLLSWRPPLFTGGLTQLQYTYNVSIRDIFSNNNRNTNLTSVILHLYDYEDSDIKVRVVNRTATTQQISKNSLILEVSPKSKCAGEVLYPPTPSLSCMEGLVKLSWVSNTENGGFFPNGGIELEYVNGSCTHPDGSIDLHHAEVQTSPSILHKNEVAVGTYCRLAMGSAKERPANCDRKQSCFCYDTIQIMYSHPAVECRVQGYVQFVNSSYQAFENDGSVEICVQARGYGFTVNVSAVANNSISPAVSHQLIFSRTLQDILCVNISIIDNDITDEAPKTFSVVLTADNELVSVGDPTVVRVINDDFPINTTPQVPTNTTLSDPTDHADAGQTAIVLGVVFGFVFFSITLMVAGSISCLVIIIRRKRQLQNSYKIPQDDVGSIDWSVEPPVLISPDNFYFHVKQHSDSDFDSQTLLDYLSPMTSDLSTTVTMETVPPPQIISTDQDTIDDDRGTPPECCEQKKFKLEELHHTQKHQTNCYNVSVESGVVLDADSGINIRKISTESAESCSQGSASYDIFEHSYIGIANNDTCACKECREQRERLYSKIAGSRTPVLSETTKVDKMNEDSTVDGSQPKNSDKLQCQNLDDRQSSDSNEQCRTCTNNATPRDTESSSQVHVQCHETDRNNEFEHARSTSNASAVHCPTHTLSQTAQQATQFHTDVKDD